MKVMSIIGIVWFSISLLFVIAFANNDKTASLGWGMMGLMYALPYSIVGLVAENKKKTNTVDLSNELMKLAELRDKQILSVNEFEAQKVKLLNS